MTYRARTFAPAEPCRAGHQPARELDAAQLGAAPAVAVHGHAQAPPAAHHGGRQPGVGAGALHGAGELWEGGVAWLHGGK